MNTSQSSVESPAYPVADWLGEAVALVQRVNARLRPAPARGNGSTLPPGRQVLTDHRCLVLAALMENEAAA